MEQVTITKIHRSDKDKTGKPYIGKNGRPYTRLGIQTQEYGAQWMSGFDGEMTKNWKEGDAVTVSVESVSGGKYLNFRPVGKVEMLEARVAKLEKAVYSKPEQDVIDIPDDDIKTADDLPF